MPAASGCEAALLTTACWQAYVAAACGCRKQHWRQGHAGNSCWPVRAPLAHQEALDRNASAASAAALCRSAPIGAAREAPAPPGCPTQPWFHPERQRRCRRTLLRPRRFLRVFSARNGCPGLVRVAVGAAVGALATAAAARLTRGPPGGIAGFRAARQGAAQAGGAARRGACAQAERGEVHAGARERSGGRRWRRRPG